MYPVFPFTAGQSSVSNQGPNNDASAKKAACPAQKAFPASFQLYDNIFIIRVS